MLPYVPSTSSTRVVAVNRPPPPMTPEPSGYRELPAVHPGFQDYAPPAALAITAPVPRAPLYETTMCRHRPLVSEASETEESTLTDSEDERPRINWLREALLCFLCIGFITVALLLVVLISFQGRTTICKSYACGEYSRLLKASMSSTMNPCHNFYEFVCEGYDKKHELSVREQQHRYHIGVVESYAALLRTPPTRQTAEQKAAKFYKTCIELMRGERNESDEFKALLKNINFTWPHHQVYPDLLRVMGTGQIYLGVSPFLVVLISQPVDESVLVHLAPGTFVFEWQQIRQRLIEQNKYYSYYATVYEIMSGVRPNTSSFSEHKHVEDIMMSRLAVSPPERTTVHLSESEFKDAVTTYEFSRWRTLLNSLFNIAQYKTLAVSVASLPFLTGLNDVMAQLSEADMTLLYEWAVLYELGLYFFPELAILAFGSPSAASEAGCLRCYVHVERYMSSALSHAYVKASVSPSTYGVVKDMILEIKHQTARRLQGLRRFTFDYALYWSSKEQTDIFGYYDIHSMYLMVLSGMYPDMGDLFLKNHINAATVWRGWAHPKLFDRSYLQDRDPYNLYHHDVKKIFVSPVALMLPLFAMETTFALKYGGLGALISTALFEDIYVNALANMTDVDRESFIIVRDCLGGGANDSHVTESDRAVYMAASNNALWDAYRAAESSLQRRPPWIIRTFPRLASLFGDQEERILGLPEYSADHLFFIIACYINCGGTKEKYQDVCNVMARNSRRFSEAFRCPIDSPMNPVQKCGL
ncbi:endothelin-converting enzyme 1-like [Ornithodoros turicata]|uniref:endothelin-converting enzyme 1-like n=1 Tax=Ornithodoros turicata TaxID=34597 RepID=UPI00313A1A6A